MSNDTITLKKITISAILNETKGNLKEKLTEIATGKMRGKPFVAVGGCVTGFGEKVTDFGTSTYLTGQLYAKNLITGEIFQSTIAYLEKSLVESIISQFKVNTGIAVNFSATISVVPHPLVGYSYVSSPIETEDMTKKKMEFLESFKTVPMLEAPKDSKK